MYSVIVRIAIPRGQNNHYLPKDYSWRPKNAQIGCENRYGSVKHPWKLFHEQQEW